MAAALLATSLLAVPMASASTADGASASVALSVSTSKLPSSGGSVVIHVVFRHVDRCRLFASSQVRGQRRWGSCAGTKAERLWLPAQGSSLEPLAYRIIAIASSPAASASSSVTVTVGRPLSTMGATSTNWTGVVATGAHDEVGATWVVPSVSGCTPGETSRSATWVGLGGQRIVQGGTDQGCDPSTPAGTKYVVWTEAYPAPQLEAFTVSPGDVIRATATQGDGTATISVVDETTGQSVSSSFPERTSLQGAEWVEEDLTNGASLSSPSGPTLFPLSDFGSVVFSAMSLDGGLPAATASPLEQFFIWGTTLRMWAGAAADRLTVSYGGA